MTGKRIKTLVGLRQAVDNRRAVVCSNTHCFAGPRPAAFMINLAGVILIRLFRSGMYLYKKGD